MKKKYLLRTLLLCMLVLTGGGKLWADETIFSTNLKGVKYSTASAEEEIPSASATFSGGKVYAMNNEGSSKDFIVSKSAYEGSSKKSHWTFQMQGSKTFFKVVLNKALQAGDIINVTLTSNKNTETNEGKKNKGIWLTTETSRPASATVALIVAPQSANENWVKADAYTVKSDDDICGQNTFYIYRATGTTTNFNLLTITRPAAADAPTLSASPNAITLSATEANVAANNNFTISGTNLTPGTYNLTIPSVQGLTVSPTSFTVAADGSVNQQITVSYTANENVSENTVNITSTVGTLNLSMPVTYSANVIAWTLQSISDETVWDFSTGVSGTKQFSGDDLNKEFVYANIPGLTFTSGFDATALAFKGEYPFRANDKKFAQNGTLRFNTTVPGSIIVKFTDTGSGASATAVKRYLIINGEQTEYWTSRANNGSNPYDAKLNVTTQEIAVPAGNVTIAGSSAIVVSYVKFKPNTAANIAAFKALPEGTEAILTLTNAKVTYNDGGGAYVEDETGAIYFNEFTDLAANQTLNGTVIGKIEEWGGGWYGLIKTASTTLDKLTITQAEVQPTKTTIDNLMQESQVMRFMKLENVTVSEKDYGYLTSRGAKKASMKRVSDSKSFVVNSNGKSIVVYSYDVNINSLLEGKRQLQSIAGIVENWGDDEYALNVIKESDVVAGANADKLNKVNSIAEFKKLADGEDAELVLNNAYVTYSRDDNSRARLATQARGIENERQLILEDATGAIPFNTHTVDLQEGQKVNGSINARLYLPSYGNGLIAQMEDMDLTSVNGLTEIVEEPFTPTEIADVKDLQKPERLFTKVHVGRSTTTTSEEFEGMMVLNTGSSSIILMPWDVYGNEISFPEQLEYVEGFVSADVESTGDLERSRTMARAMARVKALAQATGRAIYYLIATDFKEFKDEVTDYKADKQTEGELMKQGEQRKVTGVIMTATEDMPITADQKTIGQETFTSKVEGNNFQFDATRNGKLTVYIEKKAKQPVTVTEDGEPMKNFNGITMDGEFIEIPVKAGKVYMLSTTAPTLNLRGFSFADDGTSNGDLARNIATFKALYDGMVPAEATLQLTDAMVTYIKGDNVFVQDESGATVFYKTGIQFYKDQKLNGTIAGISTAEKNMPQLLSSAKTNYKTFKATKDSAASKAITVAETQLQENIARFVKLTDVVSTKDKRGFRILTDSLDNTVRIEDHFNVFYELPDTLESIEGIIGIDAEGTFYLWPTSKEGVVKKVVEPETPDNPDNPDNPDQPDQPDQPVDPDQPTSKECDVTYALTEGETHAAGSAVTISDEDDEQVVALTFGFAGGADFKAAKKDEGRIEGFTAFTEGNGENGTATSGTNYIISPKYDGTVTVGVVLNANKSFFVEEDGTALADYNGIKADPKYYGTYSFDVKGGSTYAVYCTGSKLGFYGLNYHYTKVLQPAEPELTYELVKTLDFTTATYAENPTIVLGDKVGTAYDNGNKKQQDIFTATAPEEIAGSIAFQAVSNGSGKGWWIRSVAGGMYCYNAGRSAAVLGLTTGYRVIFNCTGTASDIMTLYNANGEPDGPFVYELSEDGKQYICTMLADGNIGFCGNKNKGYISSIEIYKPSIEVSVADYTVKFVDTEGNELKAATTHQGLSGMAATISAADKEQINIDGVAYLYDSDDAEGKTIAKDGSTVVTVKFAKVTSDYAYNVQEVAAGQVVRETKGVDIPGSTIKVPYRRYNVVDGTLYEKAATSKEYNYSFKLNSDNQQEQLTYAATDKANVIFLTEGEDIQGMTPCTSNNTVIRSSNAGSGYAAEDDVELVTLTAGTYTLTGVLFDAAKTPDSYWQFKAGDTEVANLHNTTNNVHVATQEFTLTETATITITKAGTSQCGIDLIYIQSQDGQVAEKELPLVYSWESPEGTPIETGGKIAYVNGDGDRLNYKNGDYYTICLNGKKANLNDEAASANAGHMVVTLDHPLKENDVIAISAYINKNASAKSSAWIVFENGTTAESPVYSDEANIHADFGGAITTTTIVVPAEAAGSKTITLTRGQSGTNLFITKLEITREVADPTPEIDPEFVAPDGKYFLANFASELSWGAGNDWGTRASLVKHPEYVTLHKQEDGTYQMETQVSNGGTAYFFNGDYMDNGSPVNLTIKRLGIIGYSDEAETKPVYGYTIANGDNYYGWDGQSTVLGKNLSADSENAVWIIASEEEAIEGLAAATATDPMDATFLILDPNFGRNNRNVGAWTIEASNKNLSGGNNVNNCAESFHSLFTLSQKLSNAPKGLYSLRAQGFYRQDGSDEENLPYFYANDEKQTFLPKTGSENSMNDASVSFASGAYTTDRIYVQVAEDGELTIGAKNEANTELWCIWDNFELFYYGANADIEEAKAADAENDKEELERQKQEMLAQAKIKLDAMKELVESTNVYTEEAYNEYYGQWIAKYEDGTLTTIEAAALQDPSIVTGWHAQITCDNFLLSAWDTNPDFQDAPYYINSWSVEGDNDGTNFRVPFFEYWTGDDNSLGERTMTATMNNIPEGQYNISAWVRVRAKNGYTSPAYGITLQANDGEAVDVCDGAQVNHPDRQQFYLKNASASGTVGKDGVLNIKFNVAADNNISWLAFKNVKFEKVTVDGIDNLRLYEDGKVYNLRGQKVTGTLRPGLYIKNGRKVVIK